MRDSDQRRARAGEQEAAEVATLEAADAEGEAPLRVALVADNVSLRMGGEAARPLHYFQEMRRRGVDAHLVAHERTRKELAELIDDADTRVHYVRDTPLQKRLNRRSTRRSYIVYMMRVLMMQALAGLQQRRILRQLVAEGKIDLIHEVTPISPKRPSGLFGLGAPVVIGPMNGDMSYPPSFRRHEGLAARAFMKLGRWTAHLVNGCIPGKRWASALLVSNKRTRDALPIGCRGEVFEVTANAVDLRAWDAVREECRSSGNDDAVRFVFVGRLIPFKGVDMLLEAFAACRERQSLALSIIGDGPQRKALEQQASALGLGDAVTFHGWQQPLEVSRHVAKSDVFVFPSLRECGGAVIMEAMTLGKPVITLRWGGPADYAHDDCAVLLEPESRPRLVEAMTQAMQRLAASKPLRQQMGAEARRTAEQNFDWSTRVSRVMEIYAWVLGRRARKPSLR